MASSSSGDFEELMREAEELRQRFAVAHDSAAQHVGEDGARAVRVTVGGDGRVTSVEVDPAWEEAVGYGLGAAVLEAVTNANVRRLASWGEAVERGAENPGPERRTGKERGSADQASRGAFVDSAEARQTVHELLSLLDGVESELDDLDRRMSQRMQQQVVGRGPSNMVTVTMTADGQVSNVDIHRRFLNQTPERRISREVLGAFEAAYERAGKQGLDALLGDGKLASLHALTSDPAALLRRLGLDSR